MIFVDGLVAIQQCCPNLSIVVFDLGSTISSVIETHSETIALSMGVVLLTEGPVNYIETSVL